MTKKFGFSSRRSLGLVFGLVLGMVSFGWVLQAQEPTPPGFRAYSLRHAQATDIAPQLQSMLDDQGTKQEVLVERSTNRLMVRGASESLALADQLVRTLDRPVTTPATQAPVRHSLLAQGYPVQAASIDATLEKIRTKFPASGGTRATVDARTSQIIVVASQQTHQQITEMLGQADSTATLAPAPQPAIEAGPTEARSAYQLTNVTSRELEDELAGIWGNRLLRSTSNDGEVATIHTAAGDDSIPVMQIDRRNNAVSFLGTANSAEAWQRVVKAMDRKADAARQQTQVVPVANADPVKVQKAVDMIRDAAGDAESQPNQSVAMIMQPEPGQPAAAPTPANVDGAAPVAGESPVAADPVTDTEDGGLLGPVQIEYIEGLDAIVLRGHKRDVERVQRIIADIERLSEETQPAIEIYHLRHVGSQVMGAMVSEIYDEILSPRQGLVTIRPMVKPNALLLIGRPESVTLVKDLILKLDKSVDAQTQFEVFPLKHISALDAEETINNFFVDRFTEATRAGQGAQDLRPGLGTRVNVVADYRSNSLIVYASPRDLDEVRRLVARIDVEAAASTNELRIFRLQDALASEIAPILQDALNWQLIGNRTPVGATPSGSFGGGQGFGQATDERSRIRSAILTFMTVDSEGGKLLESGLLSDVRVTADVNGNALLVTGPAKSMGLIEALVNELDRLPNAKAQIKVFTIVNGDASALSSMLQQLLGQATTGTQQQNTLFGQGTMNPFLSPALQTGAATGESSLVPVRFGVDQRTNSIIASGSEGDLGVVEAILMRLDEESLRAQQTVVYWIANVPAATVATAVNDWLDQRNQLFQQQLQISPESPVEQINREIIVVAEEISNSVIIGAAPHLIDEIKQVVESLDRRPPMVKIDVLIAEVVLTDFFEFGAEYGLQDALLFDRTYEGANSAATGNALPGYNFNNAPLGDLGQAAGTVLGQGLTSFGMGRINTAQSAGGLVLSASSNSVNVLIRALQQRGRLQVLSRPTVTTLDNQPASVNVGADVSRFEGSTLSGTGNSQLNVVDVPTGIILGVTPRVTPEGIVVMEVDVTKSRLSDTEGVQLPTGGVNGETFTQFNIDRINASTTISARNGQTIVFAGLIETQDADTTKGIPWLMDIPHLGPLFSYTQHEERRGELLIVLTPRIIYSNEEEEIDWIKYSESERMSWCLSDIIELYGDVGVTSRPGWWCGEEHGCNLRHCCRHGDGCVTVCPDENPSGYMMPTDGEKPVYPIPSDDLPQPHVIDTTGIPPTRQVMPASHGAPSQMPTPAEAAAAMYHPAPEYVPNSAWPGVAPVTPAYYRGPAGPVSQATAAGYRQPTTNNSQPYPASQSQSGYAPMR